MSDLIRIIDLEIRSVIGVPDAERAKPQRLLVSLVMSVADLRRAAKSDDVRLTIDYGAVVQRVKFVAEERARHLVETLAEDIAARVLKDFTIETVLIEVKKFVVPGTQYVSVVIERQRIPTPSIRL